ncbi:MAG: AtpZ/AtpI family protein [Dehalococcoidales bacterium]|nr:AtpZ/AtpI family protein [Dehalococcoidales bacterium]
MVTQASAKKKWVIKIGLNSSSDSDTRQRIADYFSQKLRESELEAEIKQIGIIGGNACDVPVEVLAPEGENTYYELASASDVERVVKGHLVGGKRVVGLMAQAESKDKINVIENNEVNPAGMKIDAYQMREAMNLLGIGIFLAVSVMGCMGIGLWLDSMWDTKPLVMLIGLFVGIFIGIFGIYQTIAPMINKK